MHDQTTFSIIGIGGSNGAGKDTVGALLAERHGYLFISVTELLRDEARKRGLPVERQHLRDISAEWRRAYGLGVLVDRAVAVFNAAPAGAYVGVVMSSLRNPAEADRVHELGGTMVWVDADPRVRYQRVQSADRGRSGEDNKTFETFLQEEAVEMRRQSGADVATLDSLAVKERCDITLINDSDNIEVFAYQVEQAFGLN